MQWINTLALLENAHDLRCAAVANAEVKSHRILSMVVPVLRRVLKIVLCHNSSSRVEYVLLLQSARPKYEIERMIPIGRPG